MSVATLTAWQERADDLASFTLASLVNRTDRYGAYGGNGAFTGSELTESTLRRHFEGECIAGIHSTSAGETCRWLGIDIDNHDADDELATSNFDHASALLNRLSELGIAAALEDSNGDGGFHIWILFAEPVPTKTVFRFGKWLIGENDFELFPKQAELSGKGLGNWLRLPGRHHNRDHWSRFYGDGEWLGESESVDAFLNLSRNDAAVLACVPQKEPKPATSTPIREYADHSSATNSHIEEAERILATEPWSNLLEQEGWQDNGGGTWTRPGKNDGVSATLNYNGNGLFHVFSTAAGLPADGPVNGKSYGKFRFLLFSRGLGDADQVEFAKSLLPRPNKERIDAGANSPETSVALEPLEYVPFPTTCLPAAIRDYVESAASAIGCDPSYTAMPLLAALGGSIGNTRRLRVKKDWFCPPMLWCCVIGESGTSKSPAMRPITKILSERERALREAQDGDRTQYDLRLKLYQKKEKEWIKNDGQGDPPKKPTPPPVIRAMVGDVTAEALAAILGDNPRGLTIVRDELAGLFGGMDRYANSGSVSGDAAFYLSSYNCESHSVDRKTGDKKSIFLRSPAIAMFGGIQPGIFQKAIGEEHKENGMLARLLTAYPPRKQKRWSQKSIPDRHLETVKLLFQFVFSMQSDRDRDGNDKPAIIFLSDKAETAYVEFYNRTNAECVGLPSSLASAWSKLEETACRIALIFHSVLVAAGQAEDENRCSGETMRMAILLVEWFKNETERIYTLMAESEADRDRRALVEWIRQRGGAVKARDIVAGRRDVKNASDAEVKLQDLASAGLGNWQEIPPGPRGGRPTRVFSIFSNGSSAQPP